MGAYGSKETHPSLAEEINEQKQNEIWQFCAKCGFQFSKDASVCPRCGTKVGKTKKSKWWLWFLIIPVVIVILILVTKFSTSLFVSSIINNSRNNNNGNTSVQASDQREKGDYYLEYTYDCKPIEYQELARNPDAHKGEKVVVYGRITQVIENGNDVTILIDMEEDTDSIDFSNNTIYINYQKIKPDESRFLENDNVVIYGEILGTIEYTTVLKTNVRVPWLKAEYVELNDSSTTLNPSTTSPNTSNNQSDSGESSNNTTSESTQQNTNTQDSGLTTSQKNALKSAKNYLAFSAFSREGLISQLEYEKYTNEDAVFAVDNCGANWYEQALKSAKSYLDYSAFSREGLIGQLEYEKFTADEALYAVDNCGANWYEQAVKSAKSYLEFSSFSRDGLIDQLMFEGFTKGEAEYGVAQNGY